MRRISLLTAIILSLVVCIGALFTPNIAGEPLAGSALWAAPDATEEEEQDEDALLSLLLRTIEIISQRSIHAVEEDELLWRAIEGMISSLDDPYAELLGREALDSMLEDYRNRGYSGIGVQITAVPEGVRILQVFSGGPADRAGLQVGDTIIEVERESIAGMNLDEVGAMIRGEPGTTVDLLLLRAGEEIGPVTVEREEVVHPTVHFELMEIEGRDIGYLVISRFTGSTAGEVERALEELAGAESLLIDVRNNPGGTLSSAISVSRLLVPDGPILVTEGREGEVLREFTSDTPGVDVPVMILMNEYTASGAEILAGAARDRLDALLVGTETFGKGSVQSVFDLDKAGLRLTTAQFILPSGHRITDRGLNPDLRIVRTGGARPGALHVPDEPLGPGDSGEPVLLLTERLRQAGYLAEPSGGRYDTAVRRAVTQFQRDEGLTMTGRADEETLRRLADRVDSPMQALADQLREDVSEELLEKEWLLGDRQRLQALRALVRWMTSD